MHPAAAQAVRSCSTSETQLNVANSHWRSHAFLVFFDWNSEELTVRVQQIVALAVAFARNRNTRVIEINGHDDNSQSEFRAMALSQRRANAVADGLVAYLCRSDDSFRPPGVRRPVGFCPPKLNAFGAGYRSR
jgi:outer membrane protein OmpA-like peptidoglycan-associated protein